MPQGGNFWTGIAEGYLQSKRESDAQARDEEFKTKQQYASLLSSMIDRVEPESQPMLFKAIGDVMGMKGKERGIWDFISGAGIKGAQQAVQQKFQDVMGGALTAEQARNLRARQDVAGLGWSNQQAAQQMQQQAGDKLQNSIIFRDPRAEKMEDFTRQKQLMFENQQYLKEREYAAKQEQEILKSELKTQQQKELWSMDTQKLLYTTAHKLAARSKEQGGMGEDYNPQMLPEQYVNQAADYLMVQDTLEGDKLKAQIKALSGSAEGMVYMNPQTTQISFDPRPGFLPIKPSQAATFANQRISDYRQQGLNNQTMGIRAASDRMAEEAKLAKAQTELKAIVNSVKGKAAASGMNVDLTPDGQVIITDSNGQMLPDNIPNRARAGITKEIDQKVRGLLGEQEEARKNIEGYGYVSSVLGAPRQLQAQAPKAPAKGAKPQAPKLPEQSGATGQTMYFPQDNFPDGKVGDVVKSKTGKKFKIESPAVNDQGKKMWKVVLVN